MCNFIKEVIAFISLTILISCNKDFKNIDNTKYVNLFIGTQHEGRCFSGVTGPLSMVQPSPELYNKYYGGYEVEDVASYQYNDLWLIRFTQTHLNRGLLDRNYVINEEIMNGGKLVFQIAAEQLSVNLNRLTE